MERAEAVLAAHPEISGGDAYDIYTAAILGAAAAIRRFVENDAAAATVKGGPLRWDALTYLCFSTYLRLDPTRSAGFLQAAEVLLDAGASANTGFYSHEHQPEPIFESALYGAAGVAHHPALTRLLLDRGADPNDAEVVYHTPETFDNRALQVLVGSGRLTGESLAMLLNRKHDWHDYEGIKWLLAQGADPNSETWSGKTPFHNAVLSDNALTIVEVALDHGADPMRVWHPRADASKRPEPWHGMSAAAMAARRGRGDLLDLFERRGLPVELHGAEALLASCARNDAEHVRSIAESEPRLIHDVVMEGGRLLAAFAGNGNTEGVRHLLDLGVDVTATFEEGDGYFDIAPNSTALHVASWRACHDTVRFLIERGAPIDVPDGRGRTPLALAVRASVDSYWTSRRTPESVEVLLRAGASPAGVVPFPSGYAEVDALLRAHGR
ncbi:MAG: ankyrin repeat domain-containing protein [Vicinamibacteraceae bacterium]